MSFTPYTINATAYTPSGFRINVCVPFSEGAIPSASDIDSQLEAAGYLVAPKGVEAGEEMATMTFVSRIMHTNRDTGEVTPKLAFYLDHPKWDYKYDHVYFNSDEQIAEFESLSGMKLMAIPEWQGQAFLDRKHPKASEYIVRMPNELQVAVAEKMVKKPDGSEKLKMKIQRFLGGKQADSSSDTVIEMPTSDEKFTPEIAKAFSDYWQTQGIDGNKVLALLGVTRLSEWQKSVDDANQTLSIQLAS